MSGGAGVAAGACTPHQTGRGWCAGKKLALLEGGVAIALPSSSRKSLLLNGFPPCQCFFFPYSDNKGKHSTFCGTLQANKLSCVL